MASSANNIHFCYNSQIRPFFLQVRLAQARGARVRVRGPPAQGDGSGMAAVFLQLDGEPWKQDAPSKDGEFLEVRKELLQASQ